MMDTTHETYQAESSCQQQLNLGVAYFPSNEIIGIYIESMTLAFFVGVALDLFWSVD